MIRKVICTMKDLTPAFVTPAFDPSFVCTMKDLTPALHNERPDPSFVLFAQWKTWPQLCDPSFVTPALPALLGGKRYFLCILWPAHFLFSSNQLFFDQFFKRKRTKKGHPLFPVKNLWVSYSRFILNDVRTTHSILAHLKPFWERGGPFH